jgi:hypothetical protein
LNTFNYHAFDPSEIKSVSERVTTNYYAYHGPLGDVVRDGVFFFASKDGFPIGTFNTFEAAMASLEWKARVKAQGYSLFTGECLQQ